MAKTTAIRFITDNVNGIQIYPSESILSPTSSNPATAAEFEILVPSALPGNIISNTQLNPYIRIPIISSSANGLSNDSELVIRFFTGSHFTSLSRTNFSDDGGGFDNFSSSLYYTGSVEGTEYRDTLVTSGSAPSNAITIRNRIHDLITGSTFFKNSVISASKTGDLTSSIFLNRARGAINNGEVGTGSLNANEGFILNQKVVGTGTFNFVEAQTIALASASLLIKFDETDPTSIKFAAGTSSLGFGSRTNKDLLFFSSSGNIGINTNKPKSGFDVLVNTATFQNPGTRRGLLVNDEGNIESFNRDAASSATGSEFVLKYSRGILTSDGSASKAMMDAVFGTVFDDDAAANNEFQSLPVEEQQSILTEAEQIGFLNPPQVGDVLGSIRFIAESGSVASTDDGGAAVEAQEALNSRTTGEAASIQAKVHTVDSTGVRGDLVFNVADQTGASVQRMVIDAGDNHQLSGSLIVGGTDSQNATIKMMGTGGNNQAGFFRVGSSIADLKIGRMLLFDDGTQKVQISAKGKSFIAGTSGTGTTGTFFGINTQDPTRALQVEGSISASNNFFLDGDIRRVSSITSSGNISSSGNLISERVIIGESDLSRALNVNDTSEANGEQIAIQGSTSTGATIRYNRGASFSWRTGIGASGTTIPTSFFGIQQVSGNKLGLVIAHTTMNVGVNTASPDAQLTVSGSLNMFGEEGNITASGNISASGNIISNQITSSGEATFGGNVGIGGVAGTKTLTVTGTMQSTGEAFFSHFDNLTSNSRFRDNLALFFGVNRVLGWRYNSTLDKLVLTSGSAAHTLTLDGSGNISGSGTLTMGNITTTGITNNGDLTVTGTLTAQEFKTEFVSSSIIFSSGSTKFGDTQDDVHNMTGSLLVTGSAIFDIGGRDFKIDNLSGFPRIFGDNSLFIAAGSNIQVQNDFLPHSDNSIALGSSTRNFTKLHINSITASSDISSSGTIISNKTLIGTTSDQGDLLQVGVASSAPSFTTDPDVATTVASTTDGHEVAYQLYVPEGTNNIRSKYFIDDTTLEAGFDTSYSTGLSGFVFQLVGSEKMRINVDGKVGIGTSSPSSQFHVSSSTGFNITTERGIEDTARDGFAHHFTAGNAHILGRALILENSLRITPSSPSSTTKTYRFLNDSSILKLGLEVGGSTQNSNIFSVSSSNVGIGTTTPGELLHVAGNITLGNNKKITFRDSSGNDGTSITYDSNALFKITQANSGELRLNAGFNDNSNNKITFLTQGSSERMRITNAGRVGVGTTTPSSTLHISSSENIKAIIEGDDGGQLLRLKRTDQDKYFDISLEGNDLRFNPSTLDNSQNVLFGVNAGSEKVASRVGIGQGSPQSELDISGSLTLSGPGHITASGDISSSGIITLDETLNFGATTGEIRTTNPNASGNININPDGQLNLGSDRTDNILIGRQNNTGYTTRIFGGNSTINIKAGLNYVELNVPVTASGNISASGTIIGNLVPQVPKVEMLSVTSSTLIENKVMTLPNSLTYITSSGGYEYLEIFADGIRLNRTIDYTEVDTSSVRYLISIPSQSVITYKSLRTV